MPAGGDRAACKQLGIKVANVPRQAVAHLQHPNIVQIYDVDERDGKPFFSLEYIDGGSLQGKIIQGKPWGARPAAEARSFGPNVEPCDTA